MSEQITSAKAVAKTVRIAPRKARLVVDLIRGKKIGDAISILKFTPRAASPIVEKVLYAQGSIDKAKFQELITNQIKEVPSLLQK